MKDISMKFRFLIPCLAAVLLAGAATVQAQVTYDLVQYNFTTSTPSAIASDVSADNATWAVGGGGFGGSDRVAYNKSANLTTDFSTTDYFEITLSADTGYELDLSTLTFQLGGSNTSTSAATMYAQVRTSLDNYTSSVTLDSSPETEASVSVAAGATFSGTKTLFTFDVSDEAYQNISEITVRVYAYATGDTAAYWKLDNLTVAGTVVNVPEASTLALFMGTVALGTILWVRRRSLR
jgi:hypothetical protein